MFAILLTKILPFYFGAGASCTLDKSQVFFFLPPWWEFIKNGSSDVLGACQPALEFPSSILSIGLAIIDILLRLAGLAATISIIIAGVTYMTAGGDVSKTASARRRIYNAFIGLAIVSIATVLVTFIGNSLGG
jgi:hypothetical protein